MPSVRKPTVAQPPNADTAAGNQRELRLRVYAGSVIAMGPGKAELLSAIEATGSISAAARAMGMSYKRGWDLVAIMNERFASPLVATSAGGTGGGGTSLTPLGVHVLRDYQRMQEVALAAIASDLRKFRKHLK